MTQFYARIRRAALFGATALTILATALPVVADQGEDDGENSGEPTVTEQLLGLESMCSQNSEAMNSRHAEEPLYARLGGEEKIREVVTEIVRLHFINPELESVMDGIHRENLITRVSQFIVAGTGGPPVYKGRDMTAAHSHLKLTNAHFLAAGRDVMQAMKSKGCTDGEIQEIVCTLVALRPQVVVESERELR